MLDATGYTIIKQVTKTVLGKITDLILSKGDAIGRVKVLMKGGENYKAMVIRYSIDDSIAIKDWKTLTVASKIGEILNPPVGEIVYVSITAIGKPGERENSNVAFIAVE